MFHCHMSRFSKFTKVQPVTPNSCGVTLELQGSKEQDGERPEKAKNLVPLKALSDIFVTKRLGVQKTGELLESCEWFWTFHEVGI